MPGGLLQIASSGVQDIYLTKNPEITFFKKTYKRYTNFSIQTIQLPLNSLPDYNEEFSIDILKYGDLIHRAYFEIVLPNINLDNISSNISSFYTDSRNNKKKDLLNEINKWTTEYNMLSEYCNIQIIAYKEILILIDSDDIQYEDLVDIISSLQFKYNSILNNSIFIIDENIKDLLNLIEYVINLKIKFDVIDDESQNLFTIETFKSKITQFYTRINKELLYYYYYLKKLNDELNELNKDLLKYSWIENIGHHFFRSYEIQIGGKTIEEYDNNFLNIYQNFNIKDNEKQNYDSLIGNLPKLTKLSSNKGNNKIYIPLIFWFNRNSINSLPLVSLKYNEININLKINSLEKLINFENFDEEYKEILKYELHLLKHRNSNNLVTSLWDFNKKVNKFDIEKTEYLINSRFYIYNFKYITRELLLLKFKNLNETDVDILFNNYSTDNIKLTKLDYKNFRINALSSNNDNIIKVFKVLSVEYYPFYELYQEIINSITKPKINFFVEYIYIDELERFKFSNNNIEYVVDLILNTNKIQSLTDNIIEDIELSKTIKDIFLFNQPSYLENGFNIFDYKNPNIYNSTNIKDFKLATVLSLGLKDFSIFDFKHGENYLTLTTKNKLNSFSNDCKYYYYSFGLYPMNHQPSGSCNLSVLKSMKLSIKFDTNFIKYLISINKNINSYFYCRQYRLLVLNKGQLSLL